MNELMKFDFNGKQCRTVEIDNRPWWVGKDVCSILGYKDESNALKLHCKGVVKYHPLQTAGGMQKVRIINEPDLYRFVSGSKLPEAQRFEAWIYEEVIPSVMHTGKYEAVPSASGFSREANELINKAADVIRYYQSANQRLHRDNMFYRKIEQLTESLEKTGRPLSREEQEKVLQLSNVGFSAAEIAQNLNRRSVYAVRTYLKKVKPYAER